MRGCAADARRDEDGLVTAAREGDQAAFERLIAPHRGEVHALCYRMLAWRFENVHSRVGSYLAVAVGPGMRGVVEGNGQRAFWLPYVQVPDIDAATEEASRLGASVLLPPREGPAGWRAVVATHDSGPVAFWLPKR